MTLTNNSIQIFVDSLVNKLFKILPLYEEESSAVQVYTESLAIQLEGFSNVSTLGKNIEYLNLVCSLNGLIKELTYENNHKTVKREVFKLISLAKDISHSLKEEGV